MKGVAFDIRGPIGHFRMPDTTATHLTYPFIPPTAAKGLVGAILGIEDFVTKDQVGIQLLSRVQTSAQQMSMLGKDTSPSFNRPTTMELVVQPHYRIYYSGQEYLEPLITQLQNKQSYFPTYLGVAYALTHPRLYRIYEDMHLWEGREEVLEILTVVPTMCIERIDLTRAKSLSRASGFPLYYHGNRTFSHTINYLYDRSGHPISIYPKVPSKDSPIRIVQCEEGMICLV